MSSGGLSVKASTGLVAKLASVKSDTRTGRRRGLWIGGEHVLGVSNDMVPHEDGDLERSGAVSQDDDTDATAISYDTDYAVEQHENLELGHDEGRQAKFLEQALYTERDQVAGIIATAIKKELGL